MLLTSVVYKKYTSMKLHYAWTYYIPSWTFLCFVLHVTLPKLVTSFFALILIKSSN